MSIEEILAAMKNITDAAESRNLTNEEVTNYESLEAQLATARKTQEIRNRQTAYETPANVATAVHVGGTQKDPYDDYNKAYENYLRTGKANSDLVPVNFAGQPQNAQEAGTDSEGGYLVSPQFRQKLVEVRAKIGGFSAEVDSFTTAKGGTLEYPSVDDTANSGAITDEEGQVSNGADLAFGTVNLGAFKYTSTGGDGAGTGLRVSWELLQDSEFPIQDFVARKLGQRIQRKESADWVNGNGTTLPFGVLHDGLTADVVLDTEATLVYLNLLEAEEALDDEYRANAKWLMSSNTWILKIKALEDTTDRPLIMPNAESGLGGRPGLNLMGYPVVIDNNCNAITQDGVDGGFMGLGDWKEAYVIRRVSNFVLVVDPYSRKGNGQVEYIGWERADGNIQNRSAYATIENITT
jgi:HK97 family phage major capsid protein